MQALSFHAAASVEDAATRLAASEEGKLLAGGQTLLPTIKQRLAAPTDLVSLRGAGLSGISMQGAEVVIGAMTTHAEVAGDAIVRREIPALSGLAGGIGDPQVRHRGTIGGSIANNDPAADYPAALLALSATVVTNRREMGAGDYFTGLFSTALEDGEIILAVRFPKPARAAYAKFPNPASRYAMVGVFVAQATDGVRVAVTGASEDGVFLHEGLSSALSATFSPEAVDNVEVSAEGLLSDIHGKSDYRAHLIKVMTRRAVAAAH